MPIPTGQGPLLFANRHCGFLERFDASREPNPEPTIRMCLCWSVAAVDQICDTNSQYIFLGRFGEYLIDVETRTSRRCLYFSCSLQVPCGLNEPNGL